MDKTIRDIFTEAEWTLLCNINDELCNNLATLHQEVTENKERTSEAYE